MLTLTLLHPVQATPVQSWSFEHDSVIRIGRSMENQVVLYSAVVSRHHVELRRGAVGWELVSIGANGTYVQGKRITRAALQDGLVFRLARSGPNLQVNFPDNATSESVANPMDAAPSPETSPLSEPGLVNLPSAAVPPAISPAAMPYADVLESEMEPVVPDRFTDLILEEDEPAPPAYEESELLFSLTTGKPLQVLKTVGDYQVVKCLGQGEVGITYLAWQTGRTVILKTLSPEWLHHSEAINQFTQQAKALSPINHPGIPRVVEFLTIAEQPYLVLEMVYGQSLAEFIQQYGPVSQREAVIWGLEICDILQILHRQSPPLIHGDIQPKHLIRRSILRSGQAITLVDFGAVRQVGWLAGNSLSDGGYAAPEVKIGDVTPASDFYALGTTLAYLLSGQSPLEFYNMGEQGYRFYPEAMATVGLPMVQVLRKLTEPNPSHRYADVAAIAADLRRII
ncbi:MAG: protein kinase [Synechococcales bacterium]|nr:protein kinase [Synechococcales bacterium]